MRSKVYLAYDAKWNSLDNGKGATGYYDSIEHVCSRKDWPVPVGWWPIALLYRVVKADYRSTCLEGSPIVSVVGDRCMPVLKDDRIVGFILEAGMAGFARSNGGPIATRHRVETYGLLAYERL